MFACCCRPPACSLAPSPRAGNGAAEDPAVRWVADVLAEPGAFSGLCKTLFLAHAKAAEGQLELKELENVFKDLRAAHGVPEPPRALIEAAIRCPGKYHREHFVREDEFPGFLERALTKLLPSMSRRPPWLPMQGPEGGQMAVPPNYWGLSIEQLNKVASYITDHPDFRGGLTMTDVVEQWVKGWTAGTGCGVALLLNGSNPRPAQVMISHAWKEAFSDFVMSICNGAKKQNLAEDSVIWICSFANFQNEDGSGPDVRTQIKADPFGTVIRSQEVQSIGMRVVLNAETNVYSRLWCVYEMQEALNLKVNVQCWTISSDIRNMHKLKRMAKVNKFIDARSAECFLQEDKVMITGLIEQGIGWDLINQSIQGLSQELHATFEGSLRNANRHEEDKGGGSDCDSE
uniref:Uncharacterized protein n=1 Tax=Zooxanthella nutricula TaxID=1333877 RepID=A0A7S2MPN2_9DINO